MASTFGRDYTNLLVWAVNVDGRKDFHGSHDVKDQFNFRNKRCEVTDTGFYRNSRDHDFRSGDRPQTQTQMKRPQKGRVRKRSCTY